MIFRLSVCFCFGMKTSAHTRALCPCHLPPPSRPQNTLLLMEALVQSFFLLIPSLSYPPAPRPGAAGPLLLTQAVLIDIHCGPVQRAHVSFPSWGSAPRLTGLSAILVPYM
uniref:Uncharacterized protein n=1 Tax=Trypanosoma vivax (strain Y486) TaxID=1055687 RepID=G0U9K9_TRYVY|nr:hypothetical protein, unlikely [Trypanosoma vivax Y486]